MTTLATTVADLAACHIGHLVRTNGYQAVLTGIEQSPSATHSILLRMVDCPEMWVRLDEPVEVVCECERCVREGLAALAEHADPLAMIAAGFRASEADRIEQRIGAGL